MHLILHIGSSKTGTTSIQQALSLSRNYLAQRGVLYPKLGNADNHNLLAASFRGSGRPQPRRLLQRYGSSDAVLSASRNAWLSVKQQAAQNDFHTIILSGEFFFRQVEHNGLAEQNKLIFPNLDSTQVIAYLRRPSSYYVSDLQQKLKAAHDISMPEREVYAEGLAVWESIGDLQLFEFNKSTLHCEDIVQDFWKTTLGSLPLPPGATSIRMNTTLSAESLYLLQRFRQARYPDKQGVFFRDSDELLKRMLLVEESNSQNAQFTRLKLHQRIRNHIDYSTDDNEILLERFGFQFDFLKCETPPDDPHLHGLSEPLKLTDIVSVDMEKVDLLVELLRTDKRVFKPGRWLLDRKLQTCLQQ